ncbi:putative membrane protein [Kineosphaera limosa]|uniref:DUF2306 domain-containing protein n=1 Tax=Kineosphaera limosa NBRC 100340 TaxID=1184609 RepID=K6VKM2_9MICO|nr:DUF2306 domain-containing protein [Kineosphaera limosa]NYE00679.1 putative membrane protein [Kineosphaera limosa]GAB96768.1 hypothetical protein KILIM_048_00060 [Kineosphaera limosa NBRC 100340]
METTAVIAAHAVAATVVITLGPINLLRRRRDAAHRLIGRVWAAAMAITCVSAFGIRPDGLTWLHGLAAFTLLSIAVGIVNIRRRNVRGHRANMVGAYFGTLIAFGFAALAPDRLIARMATDSPLALLGITALILASCAAFASLAMAPGRAAQTQATRLRTDRARRSPLTAPTVAQGDSVQKERPPRRDRPISTTGTT